MEIGHLGMDGMMTHDETDDAYHASVGISASGMKLFHELPKRFWAKYIQPDPEVEEEEEEKQHFLIGKAGHCYVLEPDRFHDAFIQMPEGIGKRTKEERRYWIEFQEKNKGKKILSFKDWRVATNCAEAIVNYPLGALIRSGKGIVESSIRWTEEVVCPITGEVFTVERKARPDVFFAPGALPQFPYGLILDLKFVADASPDGFKREADKFGYFIQAPWYQDALMKFYGTDQPAPFIFLCAEKKYPWIVQHYPAHDKFIEMGRAIIQRRLPEFARCQATGHWPAYSDGKAIPLEPNYYTYKKEMIR